MAGVKEIRRVPTGAYLAVDLGLGLVQVAGTARRERLAWVGSERRRITSSNAP
jgi:hypothetical protein